MARISGFDATTIPANYPASTELPLCHPSDDAVPGYAHQQWYVLAIRTYPYIEDDVYSGVGSFCENLGGLSSSSSQPRGLQQTYAWSSSLGGLSNPPSPKWGTDAGAFIFSVANSRMCPGDLQQHCSQTPSAWPPLLRTTTPPITHSGYGVVDFGSTFNYGCYGPSPSTTIPTPLPLFPDVSISVYRAPSSPAPPSYPNNVIYHDRSFLGESKNRLPAVLDNVYVVPLRDFCELVDISFITNVHFFNCFFDDCGSWVPDTRNSFELHLAKNHGILLRGDPASIICCGWQGCRRHIKRGNFPRHLRKHLEYKWGCSQCGQQFSRPDSVSDHSQKKAKCSGARPVSLVSPRAYKAEVLGDEVMLRRAVG